MVEKIGKNKKLDNINMKKIIRLTESDLHRLIKESVKRILKEEYDENQDYNVVFNRNLENGVYDDRILQSYKNDEDLTGLSEDIFYNELPEGVLDHDDYVFYIQNSLENRLKVLDKDYANQGELYPYSMRRLSNNEYDMPDNTINKNVKKSRGYGMNDEYWKDHDMKQLSQELPDILTKNGKLRSPKTLDRVTNNRAKYGYNAAADKGPLHRKGSLNREL